ncbi:MAG: signal peptide peptidase SppA [Muribaculum sp.]|nr:signal peptide peptidase SppA [Muribaculum sp.]
MLKRFLLNSLSSFVGAWIALALFGIAAVVTVIALIATGTSLTGESVISHSILKIRLAGVIEETEQATGIDYIEALYGNLEAPQTLDVLTQAIKQAENNKKVDAIYLECGAVSAAPATLNALRQQLLEFRKSGKKIYAYGDALTMGDYFVASVADSIYLNTGGSLAMHGISGTNLYLKDFFDKIGVQFQVVKVGTFKSAVEPYISNEMSQPARAQLDTLYGYMWGYIKHDIAESRGFNPALIDSLINNDNLMLRDADFSVKHRLVDRCIYSRQIDDILARLVGVKKEKLNFVSAKTLVSQQEFGQAYSSKNQIAVLYATGEIMEGASNGINCEVLVPQIVKLAEDDNVKGMVLRVNSPGGSVFGSEQIGEALDYFQSTGKPLSVSMGDYAASGGYWISCHADRIYADPLTITGSIGIFGLIPNVQGLEQKLGVSPQTVSTNPGANFPTLYYPLTESQLSAMQTYIEEGYDKFITRVATGRQLTKQKVKTIAEGRVWNAATAVKIGLVDELGSLDKAIRWTANSAKIPTKYEVAVYPQINNDLMRIVTEGGFQSKAFKEFCEKYQEVTPDKTLLHLAFTTLRRRHEQALAPYFRVRL